MTSDGGGLARAIVRRRWWILAGWIAAAAFLLPHGRRLKEVLDVSARVPGSESARVDSLLAAHFRSPFAHYAVLVITGAPSPADSSGARLLAGIVDSIRAIPGVTGTFSYLDVRDTIFLGRGGTFVLAGLESGARGTDALIPVLRARTASIAESLAPRAPVSMRWTGEAALNHDLRIVSAAEAQRAELRVLPITLALLLIAFGALGAAALPVAAGVTAIALTMGITTLIAERWPLSILLETIVTMIGLGVGIDYALLLVSRFREALARGLPSAEAGEEAVRHAGRTILVSGVAVTIGFAALLRVPLNELRSIAVGGSIVVLVSVLVATTLLPGLLVALGARVDLGRIRRAAAAGGPSERWRRWGTFVTRRPAAALLIAGLPVLALATAARRIDTNLPRGDWLPPRMESARGLRDLIAMDREGVIYAIRVVVRLPEGTRATDPAGWEAVRRVGDAFGGDPRVARVRSLPALFGAAPANPVVLAMLPAAVRRTMIADDERAAVIELMPKGGVDYLDITALARDVRARGAAIAAVPGSSVLVGGMAAFNADYQDAVDGRFPELVLLVVGGTLIALCLGFRSVLIPLKAVALNLLSVAAALGAAVLVFQDGYGVELVGLDAPVSGMFAAVPSLVFCIVFGLSMDYEVFLVDRVAEARRAGASDSAAIADGLAHTGGTITSAAAIMIAVFAAFVAGEFVTIKILGFALAVAVLLDATLVRVAIGPALLRLAGRWNWWPGDRASHRRDTAPRRASPVRGALLALVLAAPAARAQATPEVEPWQIVRPPQSSLVLARDGSLIGEIGRAWRTNVPIASLPKYLPNAFVAVEDQRFYEHDGVDVIGIAGALKDNLMGDRRGASTITQQLVGNMHPDIIDRRERTLSRKLREQNAARAMEKRYTKAQILEAYLNQIDFGHGWFGIESAARHYFGKSASRVTVAEAATLASIPKGPALYDPIRFPGRVKQRRNTVLALMRQQRYITAAQERAARAAPLVTAPNAGMSVRAPYFTDAVREQAAGLGLSLAEGGYRVHTTLDPALQRAAAEALVTEAARIEARDGWRHPLYAQRTAGEAQARYLQGAVVAIDPFAGDVLALVGGRDYAASPFNRAVHASRQPGSAFKPFVYAAAVRAGMPGSTIVADTAVAIPLPEGGAYEPKNADGGFRGLIPMREALVESRNPVAVQLGLRLGMDSVAALAHAMGIRSEIVPYPSSAIGASVVRPLELVAAYAPFVNLGVAYPPRMITRVEDPAGRVVWSALPPAGDTVLDPRVAFIVRDMLREVVDRGTATSVRRHLPPEIPAAGKTGTTDDNTDVWFVGMTPGVVAGVWLGFDRPVPTAPGVVGGTLAAPVWGRMMADYYARRTPGQWLAPADLIALDVDRATGAIATLDTPPERRGTEWFIPGTEPGHEVYRFLAGWRPPWGG